MSAMSHEDYVVLQSIEDMLWEMDPKRRAKVMERIKELIEEQRAHLGNQ